MIRRRSFVFSSCVTVFAVMAGVLAAVPVALRMEAIAAEVLPGGEAIPVYGHAMALYPDDEAVGTIGQLIYVGGLTLTSPDIRFGGYSDLLVSADGAHVLAISDRGTWFAFDLLTRDGRPTGVAHAFIAPMLNESGEALMSPRYDAESLAAVDGYPGEAGSGDVLVGFETKDRVERFALGAGGFAARAEPVAMPAELKRAVTNKGLEGLVFLADGRLLALTERTLDEAGNHIGWIIDTPSGASAPLSLKRQDPYELTDLARGADGDIYTLERRFSRLAGPGMRIRRIAASTIAPGAVLDGEVIAELGASSSIDNMEGLAVRSSEDGRTLLYLMSDDNQSTAQRTVLMIFALEE